MDQRQLAIVFGLQESSKGCAPADPKEVFFAFREAVIHLPDGVEVLQDDGVTWIRLVSVALSRARLQALSSLRS